MLSSTALTHIGLLSFTSDHMDAPCRTLIRLGILQFGSKGINLCPNASIHHRSKYSAALTDSDLRVILPPREIVSLHSYWVTNGIPLEHVIIERFEVLA
jgi:hypothetical protein